MTSLVPMGRMGEPAGQWRQIYHLYRYFQWKRGIVACSQQNSAREHQTSVTFRFLTAMTSKKDFPGRLVIVFNDKKNLPLNSYFHFHLRPIISFLLPFYFLPPWWNQREYGLALVCPSDYGFRSITRNVLEARENIISSLHHSLAFFSFSSLPAVLW